MQEQVAQAALAVVQPHTPSDVRQLASNFLEEFCHTPSSWNVFLEWLKSFDLSAAARGETSGMQLLCVTLLTSKIRNSCRENLEKVPVELLSGIQSQTMALLNHLETTPQQQPQNHSALFGPLTILLVTLTIKTEQVDALLTSVLSTSSSSTATTIPPRLALKLLQVLPSELEQKSQGSNHAPEQIIPKLQSYWNPLIQYTFNLLQNDASLQLLGLQVWKEWIRCCRCSISTLQSSIFASSSNLLEVLLQTLATTNQNDDSKILEFAAHGLTEALRIPDLSENNGDGDPTASAVQRIYQAMEDQGCLITPFRLLSTEPEQNEEALVAIATCASVFVTEHVDHLTKFPAPKLLQFLLDLQQRTMPTQVTLCALDVWISIPDVPPRDAMTIGIKPCIRTSWHRWFRGFSGRVTTSFCRIFRGTRKKKTVTIYMATTNWNKSDAWVVMWSFPPIAISRLLCWNG